MVKKESYNNVGTLFWDVCYKNNHQHKLRWLFFGNHNSLIAIKRIISIPIVDVVQVIHFEEQYLWLHLFFMLHWRQLLRFSAHHLVREASFWVQISSSTAVFWNYWPTSMPWKIINIELICLKILVIAVQILICVSVKYLRIWIRNDEMVVV